FCEALVDHMRKVQPITHPIVSKMGPRKDQTVRQYKCFLCRRSPLLSRTCSRTVVQQANEKGQSGQQGKPQVRCGRKHARKARLEFRAHPSTPNPRNSCMVNPRGRCDSRGGFRKHIERGVVEAFAEVATLLRLRATGLLRSPSAR